MQVLVHAASLAAAQGLSATSPTKQARWRGKLTPLRASRTPPRCAAPAARSGDWVERCVRRAEATAVQLRGQLYIPLADAQAWFEAGELEEAAAHAEQLEGVMAEQARLRQEIEIMADRALKDHEKQDEKLRQLLQYAVALEKQAQQAQHSLEAAAQQAAHEAEEHALLQYQQALLEYEKAHQVEALGAHAAEAGLRAEVKRLHDLLHAAHVAKKQWRERALQIEAQFVQLRELIQSSLQATGEGSAWRAQQGAPPPPLHASSRMRASEDVPPADADVGAGHHHPSGHGARKTAAARGKGRASARGTSVESLHSV